MVLVTWTKLLCPVWKEKSGHIEKVAFTNGKGIFGKLILS
jgi:hypothetical protein